jgi:hypothetical protein
MNRKDIVKLIAIAVVPGVIPLAIAYCLYRVIKGAKVNEK